MISIDGRVLDDNLALPGVHSLARRAGSVRYLLDGGYVDQSLPISGGQELVLEARLDGDRLLGFFTGADVEFFNSLRAAGTTVVFIHHLGTWNVRVVAVDVSPVFNVVDPGADAEYHGQVTLLIK